jgi:GAF domain-containing protein
MEIDRVQAAALRDHAALQPLLGEFCQLTGMGFVALARMSETHWIACQVIDQLGGGAQAGDETVLRATICDEVRKTGRHIVIDHVSMHPRWRTHPTPQLYGFESYASFPILLDDGAFFGTLCGIDPFPRQLSAEATIAAMADIARRCVVALQNAAVRDVAA